MKLTEDNTIRYRLRHLGDTRTYEGRQKAVAALRERCGDIFGITVPEFGANDGGYILDIPHLTSNQVTMVMMSMDVNQFGVLVKHPNNLEVYYDMKNDICICREGRVVAVFNDGWLYSGWSSAKDYHRTDTHISTTEWAEYA